MFVRIGSLRKSWPIAAAPAVFWFIGTARQVAVGDPEAFEDPILYLLIAYLFYGALFAGVGGACFALFGRVRLSHSWWGLLVSGTFGGLAASAIFAIAQWMLSLPWMAYPLAAIVGGLEGMACCRTWLSPSEASSPASGTL